MSRKHEEVHKAPYQPGDIQRRQQAIRDSQRRSAQANEIWRQRYQQETLAGDWQQDWDRMPYDNRNDKRFTAGQFVLLLCMILLVLAMAAMGAFWFAGRSSVKSSGGFGTAAGGAAVCLKQEEYYYDS